MRESIINFRRRVSTEQSSWATKSKIGKSAPTMTKARPNSSLGHYASIWEQNGKVFTSFFFILYIHFNDLKRKEKKGKYLSYKII